MPDATGKFKGIAVSRVPWHKPKQSPHWFCEGEKCERDCHCPGRCLKDGASATAPPGTKKV